jgi:hypothetical protein
MSTFKRTLLRPVAVVAAGLITATMLQAPASAASPTDSGSAWLAKQLTDNLAVTEYRDDFTDPENPQWVTYTDAGLTADVAVAYDVLGVRSRKVENIGEALTPEISGWTGDGAYANSVAKAAVTATVTGQDPTAWGGLDLVAELEARTADAGQITGRVEDDTAGTDYASAIGQAYAARALAQAGSSQADEALAFLLQQQCEEGFFRLGFSPKAAEDQSCDAAADAKPNVDVTALTVITLASLPVQTEAVTAARRAALAWLKDAQRPNGSFRTGDSAEPANTNSTGLAAWALGDASRCGAAEKAAGWVRGLQVRGNVKGTELVGEKGAIAYDTSAWEIARKKGIKRIARDQWFRASAQALPGLRFTQGC